MVEEKDFDDEEFTFEDEETTEAETTQALVTQIDSVELPSAWGQTATNIDEVRKHRHMFNLKHGMFANVPLICKGFDCPLFDTCSVDHSNLPVGKRCPIEIAAIIELYDKYIEKLGINADDYFDQSQVKDLVDIEIKLMRVNGRLASAGDFIEQVVAGVAEDGTAYHRPELHKATEYEQQLLTRKYRILNDLMATRKSKNKDDSISDPSSFASSLMRKAMKLAQQVKSVDTIDVDAEDVTNDIIKEEGE